MIVRRAFVPGVARRAGNGARDYDPEDTVQFYALRLQEVGIIKSQPAKTQRTRHRLAVTE